MRVLRLKKDVVKGDIIRNLFITSFSLTDEHETCTRSHVEAVDGELLTRPRTATLW
jgi:hypothetical protein